MHTMNKVMVLHMKESMIIFYVWTSDVTAATAAAAAVCVEATGALCSTLYQDVYLYPLVSDIIAPPTTVWTHLPLQFVT